MGNYPSSLTAPKERELLLRKKQQLSSLCKTREKYKEIQKSRTDSREKTILLLCLDSCVNSPSFTLVIDHKESHAGKLLLCIETHRIMGVNQFLHKPYRGSYYTAAIYDRRFPDASAVDVRNEDGRTVTDYLGDTYRYKDNPLPSYDTHTGYDSSLPTGTPILAVADGVVTLAEPRYGSRGSECGNFIITIEHDSPSGETFRSLYAHLSRFDVVEGQTVAAGQQIGLSGDTGCTTGPHLHFGMYRKNDEGHWKATDPFGWLGSYPDPWEQHSEGVPSDYLWLPGQAIDIHNPKDEVIRPNVGVSRLFNIYTGVHFYTASEEERNVVGNYNSFNYEGRSFIARDWETPGTAAVRRFFNTGTGTHFYTISADEANAINATLPSFNEEGVAYYAFTEPQAGTIPLYRFFNTRTETHFYTPSEGERNSVMQNLSEYNYENVAYWVYPPDATDPVTGEPWDNELSFYLRPGQDFPWNNWFVGDSDPVDTIRFSTRSDVQLTLTASGMSADMDLYIVEDFNGNGVPDNGEFIAASTNVGSADERIDITLSQGTYMVAAYQDSGNTLVD